MIGGGHFQSGVAVEGKQNFVGGSLIFERMPNPRSKKKDIPPDLPQKPGTGDVDVDDAMIEPPRDDAFEKDRQDKGDGVEDPPPRREKKGG
jgi:hypothetical protein